MPAYLLTTTSVYLSLQMHKLPVCRRDYLTKGDKKGYTSSAVLQHCLIRIQQEFCKYEQRERIVRSSIGISRRKRVCRKNLSCGGEGIFSGTTHQ